MDVNWESVRNYLSGWKVAISGGYGRRVTEIRQLRKQLTSLNDSYRDLNSRLQSTNESLEEMTELNDNLENKCKYYEKQIGLHEEQMRLKDNLIAHLKKGLGDARELTGRIFDSSYHEPAIFYDSSGFIIYPNETAEHLFGKLENKNVAVFGINPIKVGEQSFIFGGKSYTCEIKFFGSDSGYILTVPEKEGFISRIVTRRRTSDKAMSKKLSHISAIIEREMRDREKIQQDIERNKDEMRKHLESISSNNKPSS